MKSISELKLENDELCRKLAESEAKVRELEEGDEALLAVLPEDFGAVEYIKSLESQLRASQERELALRSVLDEVQDYRGACHCAMDDEYVVGRITEALSATSTAAEETVKRIERGALEKAVDRVDAYVNQLHPPMGRAAAPLRAAILGEKGGDDGSV